MEKVSFSTLNLTLKEDVKTIKINNVEIEVKQYLTMEKQINIISNTLMYSADDNNFANPSKMEVFFNLELIYAYTNLEFTEEEKNDPVKLYDILDSNNIFELVINAIPQLQYNCLLNNMTETINNYYKQQNSALGILERASIDYKDLDFNAENIREKISNPANLELLKSVIEKLD